MVTAFQELIARRRSVRRFKPQPVERTTLAALLEAARLAPSAGNRQPLVFLAIDDPKVVRGVFPTLKWAVYLEGKGSPLPGSEPTAYIVIAIREDLNWPEAVRDVGAAAMTILLGACASGLGACWIRSIDRPPLAQLIGLPDSLEIDSVIALGTPAEAPVVEKMSGDEIKYWRDEKELHHVPKRAFDQVCFLGKFGQAWS